MRLGVANNMHPLSWGGGGKNGKDPEIAAITLSSYHIALGTSTYIAASKKIEKGTREAEKSYHKTLCVYSKLYN